MMLKKLISLKINAPGKQGLKPGAGWDMDGKFI
jgi:hypothetical protein